MITEWIQLFESSPTIWALFVFAFSLLVGSFLNVVIYRFPVMMERDWRSQCLDFIKNMKEWIEPSKTPLNDESLKALESSISPSSDKFTISVPRSACRHCQHKIAWYENIPVVSYLVLRGKCSGCKAGISLRYPIIELLTGLLAVYAAHRFGVTGQTIAVLIFTYVLIALTMIDFDHKLLPDDFTLPILWLGLIVNIDGMFCSLEDAVIGAAAGYLSLWSVFHLFKLLTGKEGMGYGDFKLLAALGAWLGWQLIPTMILLSSLVGAVVGISMILIRGHDKNIPIPFGPYIAAAGLIALYFGADLNTWYLASLHV